MHVQRAIEFSNPPATILCTDVSDMRLNELCDAFAADAKAKGIEFICLNPLNKAEYGEKMSALNKPVSTISLSWRRFRVIADAATYLAP
jgi:hypothetical protein